jgi:hypothetical protein
MPISLGLVEIVLYRDVFSCVSQLLLRVREKFLCL